MNPITSEVITPEELKRRLIERGWDDAGPDLVMAPDGVWLDNTPISIYEARKAHIMVNHNNPAIIAYLYNE